MLSTSLPSLVLVSYLTLSCKLLTEDCRVLTHFLKEQTAVGISVERQCCTMSDVIFLLMSWNLQMAASLHNLVANCSTLSPAC